MNNANIVLVEDEQIVSMDIKDMVEEANYSVTATAENAENALEILDENDADIVLMDIRLPGEMDGINATEIIKEKHDIPVVYLTAYSDEKTLKRAQATQPAGFLVKPVTGADLQTTIEMVLGSNGG
jgi:DNA-binding NarL/FixJ family response regulator